MGKSTPSTARKAGRSIGSWLLGKAESRNMTPGSLVEAQADWEVARRAYRGRHPFASHRDMIKEIGPRPGSPLF